jgi:hypothetical protein
VKQEFDRTDADKSGSLDLQEITTLLDRLNLKLKKEVIKQKFAEVDAGYLFYLLLFVMIRISFVLLRILLHSFRLLNFFFFAFLF